MESCRSIVGAAKRLEKAIREEIPELEVLGKPLVSVVAFKERKGMDVNIYQLGDYLGSKGWHCKFGLKLCGISVIVIWVCWRKMLTLLCPAVTALQFPPALHIACTKPTTTAIDTLIEDLKEGVTSVKGDKDGAKGDMVTLYGKLPSSYLRLLTISSGFFF